MQTRILLIRHGEKLPSTSHNSLEKCSLSLTDKGKQEANLIGKFLKRRNIAIIYSSNIQRAILTAEISNKELKVVYQKDPRFNERVLFTKNVKNELAKKMFMQAQDNWSLKFVGGESINEAVERFEAALYEILKKYKGQNIAIFTHGRIIQSYIHNIFPNLGFNKYDLLIPNGSITEIVYKDNIPQSIDLAAITHLKEV